MEPSLRSLVPALLKNIQEQSNLIREQSNLIGLAIDVLADLQPQMKVEDKQQQQLNGPKEVENSNNRGVDESLLQVNASLGKRKQYPVETVALTEDEIKKRILEAKLELGLNKNGKINIAVVGTSGVGKSSLVNALIGKKNGERGAAPVAETNTTLKTLRRKYMHSHYPTIAFWDIECAATQTYTTDNKLWGFDVVLIVSASRFMEIDWDVWNELRRYNVPCVFVRTKADLDLCALVEDNKASDMKKASSLLRNEIESDFHNQIQLAGYTSTSTPNIPLFIVCANGVRQTIVSSRKNNPYAYRNTEGIKDDTLEEMDEHAFTQHIFTTYANNLHPNNY